VLGVTLTKVLTPVGLVTAVAFAVYGEPLKAWFNPIELRIEVLSSDERNQHLDSVQPSTDVRRVYCHHLKVRNLTPHTTLINCRVWLKRIFILDESRPTKPEESVVFGVPRLMEWAPSEYSPDKRTFANSEIFDLGQTWQNTLQPGDSRGGLNGFTFTIHRDQAAAIELLKKYQDRFGAGGTLECVLFATADNYHAQKEFRFRIEVKPIKTFPGRNPEVEASEITAVEKRPKPQPLLPLEVTGL
jgi:hypothetical protein